MQGIREAGWNDQPACALQAQKAKQVSQQQQHHQLQQMQMQQKMNMNMQHMQLMAQGQMVRRPPRMRACMLGAVAACAGHQHSDSLACSGDR